LVLIILKTGITGKDSKENQSE